MSAQAPFLALFAAIACILLAGPAAAASGPVDPVKTCPEFPRTKKMKLQLVAAQMGFNDVPMDIRRFDTEESPAEVLAFYRAKWGVGQRVKPGSTEYPLGDFQVIASLQEPCFYTVQVKQKLAGGSEGFLGLSAPPSDRTTVKEEVPMLPGSRMVNDINHFDAGKTARTVMILNKFSPEANADFYRRNLGDRGWDVVTHHRGKGRDAAGENIVLRNGVREVSVVITRKASDESTVLLNYVDQP